jgi:hypothetical protein
MAFSKAKDAIGSIGGSDVEKAIVKATLHTARELPPEKYVQSNF